MRYVVISEQTCLVKSLEAAADAHCKLLTGKYLPHASCSTTKFLTGTFLLMHIEQVASIWTCAIMKKQMNDHCNQEWQRSQIALSKAKKISTPFDLPSPSQKSAEVLSDESLAAESLKGLRSDWARGEEGVPPAATTLAAYTRACMH